MKKTLKVAPIIHKFIYFNGKSGNGAIRRSTDMSVPLGYEEGFEISILTNKDRWGGHLHKEEVLEKDEAFKRIKELAREHDIEPKNFYLPMEFGYQFSMEND